MNLSDPEGHIPWSIWRDGGCEAATDLPAGHECPAPDRILTGWDFDLESMQVAKDGTLWFGEEFGPARMIAFPMIWLGLAIYTGSMLRQARRNRATLAVRDA